MEVQEQPDAGADLQNWREYSGFDHPDLDQAVQRITSQHGEKPTNLGELFDSSSHESMFLAIALAKGPSNMAKDLVACYSDTATTATLFLGIVMTYLMEPPGFEESWIISVVAYYFFGVLSLTGFTVIILWNLLLSFLMEFYLREADYLVFLVKALPSMQHFIFTLFLVSLASTVYFILIGMLSSAELWVTIPAFFVVSVSISGFVYVGQRVIIWGPHSRVLNDYWFQRGGAGQDGKKRTANTPTPSDPTDMKPIVHDFEVRKRKAKKLADQDVRTKTHNYVPCDHLIDPPASTSHQAASSSPLSPGTCSHCVQPGAPVAAHVGVPPSQTAFESPRGESVEFQADHKLDQLLHKFDLVLEVLNKNLDLNQKLTEKLLHPSTLDPKTQTQTLKPLPRIPQTLPERSEVPGSIMTGQNTTATSPVP